MLPRNFIPAVKSDLVRLGRDNDGGYLVERDSVSRADCLVSFGIDTDTSFECDFLSRKSVPVYAYDHTINYALFARRIYFHGIPRDLIKYIFKHRADRHIFHH